MIYLLHGDDISASRKFYSDLVAGYTLTVLDGKALRVKDLEEHLLSTSLFDEKKAIVVENLLSKNAKKKEFATFLNSQTPKALLVLWEDKKLPKTSLNLIKNATIKDFLLPQNYFQFLDSYAPGNGKRLFIMYHELLSTMSGELVFYSLIKRIRLLVVLSSESTISDLTKMAPWQVSRLKTQLRLWNRQELLQFYKKLQETEIKMKSGRLPVGLSKHLDILILTHLI